jgi:hypothetical protein
MALLVRPTRLLRSAIVLKPSTLLATKAMSKQKYRVLFSASRRRKPGPKGPSAELIRAVVEMKQRNPSWGCPRIAQQIALAFHIQIDKDVVRRILGHHYPPGQSPVVRKNSIQRFSTQCNNVTLSWNSGNHGRNNNSPESYGTVRARLLTSYRTSWKQNVVTETMSVILSPPH